MTPPRGSSEPSPRRALPLPLVVAVAVVGLESLVLIVEGLSLLPALGGERLTMVATSVLFFVIYGGGLGYCAWALRRLRSWSRAPVVLAQLIQILVGAGFWGGATTPIAVALVGLGVLVLVGVFHPASLAALERA